MKQVMLLSMALVDCSTRITPVGGAGLSVSTVERPVDEMTMATSYTHSSCRLGQSPLST